MNMKIEIETKTFVRFWLVVIGFALAALLIYQARTALIIIGAALFFAIALSPIVNRLAKILPSKSRVLVSAISYVAVVLVLGVIVFLVIPPIAGQTSKFANNLPNLIDSASTQYSGIQNFIDHYGLRTEFDKIVVSLKDSATTFASGFGSSIITGITSVISTVASIILMLVLSFLMLVDGPNWLKKLWSYYKDDKMVMQHERVLAKMYNVITSYVTGQLSVSAIAGAASGIITLIVCLVFSVPVNLAIPAAAIVFVLSLIPLFGEATGSIIICLVLMLNSIPAGLAYIIIFAIYGQIEANFIQIRIQSKKVELSALAVLLAVTIGIYLFGIIGAIISIPIAGCVRVLINEFFSGHKKQIKS